ncbi:MAG TPA: RDD family protein [Pyrinomonadaceae bacterium]|nr:RDD family protein [Pyrinomonadaceae bacterium]
MTCPVCKRELAPTLSICLTCGAMMHDTVREEMETKIGKLPYQAKTEIPVGVLEHSAEPLAPPMEFREVESPRAETFIDPVPPPAPVRKKAVTAELKKKETSPTLIDFQHKSPAVPDWRLQLQNSIRKRTSNGPVETGTTESVGVAQSNSTPSVVGASTRTQIAPDQAPHSEKVANALKRIEESRRVYSAHGMAVSAARRSVSKPTVANRSFPFDVVERAPLVSKREVPKPSPADTPKPKLVSPLRIEKKKFDTNKLPPIPEPESPLPAQVFIEPPAIENRKQDLQFERLHIRNDIDRTEIVEQDEANYDEIEDLAPLSMRFGAAVFDLIIGGFAAGILLSPFLVSSVNLATVSGFLAVGGAVLLVMFIYQTVTTAFIGRTFGMKLFALEIIDAEKNESPTLHQAAVNSAVYLLSLLLFGLGFLPAFFNEERRMVHDILSGTLLIREY